MGTLTKLDLRVEFETCGNSHKIIFKSRIRNLWELLQSYI
ncbi:hypothetical protein LEP1GSC127_1121 [Leptospira kirschneri str. 200801925]|nr:hypothetical protein LEP1GSC127_1121 [Leptospira kirschneri str. 200801925]